MLNRLFHPLTNLVWILLNSALDGTVQVPFHQGVGVLTSAIAARVESKQVNEGGSAKERQPGHSAVTVGILLCPGCVRARGAT